MLRGGGVEPVKAEGECKVKCVIVWLDHIVKELCTSVRHEGVNWNEPTRRLRKDIRLQRVFRTGASVITETI